MRPTPLDEIRQAIHGRWLTASSEAPVNISRAVIDSRKAGAGDLFIAICGEKFDGHDFLIEAADAGCASAVVKMDTPICEELADIFDGGLIGVEDTAVALGELARMHRKRFAGQVIAVTGSVGKTTVKRMIHHILSRKFTGSAAPASYNNHIGVPLTLLAHEAADDYVVCELGSNAPGEIASLTRIAKPDLAVITAVGPSHLQKLQSIDRVAMEKAAILGGMDARGVAVVNADSETLMRALCAYDNRTIGFGTSDQAQLRLTGWEAVDLGQRFQINDRLWVDLPMPGKHNAFNALAALAVALKFGIDQAEAAASLADFQAPNMRMQARQVGPITLLNDAYNANPMSMAAALTVLGDLTSRRRVFVAGDMLELGDAAEQYHRELGRHIAQSGIGLLVAVGELGRIIADEAGAAGLTQVQQYETAPAAADDVQSWLRSGDAVLVKASRGIGAECVAARVAEIARQMGESSTENES